MKFLKENKWFALALVSVCLTFSLLQTLLATPELSKSSMGDLGAYYDSTNNDYYLSRVIVGKYGQRVDFPDLDAFGRAKMSTTTTLFDSKQLFDNQPLAWDDAETSGGSTTSSHSVNTASTTIGVGNTTAGVRTRQTMRRFNYQPGKSQLIMMTGVLDKSGGGTGITRFIGPHDDENGLFFKDNEGTYQVGIRTYTSGSAVDTVVSQASWNLDTLDGDADASNPSGITIDFSKTQIFVFDYEWLGVGDVRFGFFIDGHLIWCHVVHHANVDSQVYMSTPNLPLRYSIENDGTGAASTLECICSTVISEGGLEPTGHTFAAGTNGTHVDADSADSTYAVVGIRLDSAELDGQVTPKSVSMINESNQDFQWLIYLNPTVAGTFTYSDVTNSVVESATGATANTISGGTILASGFVKSGSQTGQISEQVYGTLKLGSQIDSTADELVLAVKPLAANADIQGSITWLESD